MLRVLDEPYRNGLGVHRREWLKIGAAGLGGFNLGAPQSNAAPASSSRGGAFGRAKSVILFGLVGGPPQHETFDPKPDAPAEVRGEFGTIASRTPGLLCGELMPRTATLTDKLAVLRAVVTGDNAHSSSGYQMLTGVPHIPLNVESVTAKAPNLMPCQGSIVRALRPAEGQLPSAITIPEHIWNDGNFPWPGQDSGVLGLQHDPWLIPCDPSEAKFNVPALSLPGELTSLQFTSRRTLLDQFNAHLGQLDAHPSAARFNVHQRKALDLLSSTGARDAFDLGRESVAMRDRYGRSRFAQSVLLARRLVEANVGLIQINWTRIKDQPNQGGWDTHATHNKSCKDLLMPMMDQCFHALITDLDERGLLDETLVVWFGEFGRTPKFNKNGGRDHWGHCFSIALAGGGIRGGAVYGESDRDAAFPISGKVTPADIWATVYHCLGYDPETMIHDTQNRPMPISRGHVIHAIV
ncbi:MAG: DUF1501 domain-containing protein [Planctomycetaceae bacterium]|nr:DUF1501 domain-containing protein [Planctomycetaceae bacterium]